MIRLPQSKTEREVPYCQKEFPCLTDIDICKPVPLRLVVSDASRIMYFLENFDGLTTREQEYDINTYLKKYCQASDVFIIHMLRATEHVRIQMVNDNILENEIVIPMSGTIMNSIVEWDGKAYVCSEVLNEDMHAICKQVIGRTGDVMHVIPIICSCRRGNDETLKIRGNPVALVCLLNCAQTDFFVLRATQELFRYCTTNYLNTMEGEEECKLRAKHDKLVECTVNVFKYLHDMDQIIREIVNGAKKLVQAERCTLFVVDLDHMDLISKALNIEDDPPEIKITTDQAIAGHVAATGKLMNILNPREHPLFNLKEDKCRGSETRNILCFPMKNEKRMLVGVGQVVNKIQGNFDYTDEEVIEIYSTNCAVALLHAIKLKHVEESFERINAVQTIITRKKQVMKEEVIEIVICPGIHRIPDFNSPDFPTSTIIATETVCYILKMFEELGYLARFSIDRLTLIKFFLTIRKAYSENPYRNWQHGFGTGHFIYSVLKNLDLMEHSVISPLEALSLLIAAFCHDVARVGSTNPYILDSKSVLANFYTSESAMYVHNSAYQTLAILTLEGCNILEGLPISDYQACVNLIKELIVATDLRKHLKLLIKQKLICTEIYNHQNPSHRYYLCSLLMTASDMADFVKDLMNTKRILWYILEELLTFGDMEIGRGIKTLRDMDRNRIRVPELLVNFLEEIVNPIFNILVALFPSLTILRVNLDMNIAVWKRLIEYFHEQKLRSIAPLDILLSDDLDLQIEYMREDILAQGTGGDLEGEDAVSVHIG